MLGILAVFVVVELLAWFTTVRSRRDWPESAHDGPLELPRVRSPRLGPERGHV